MDGLWNHPTLSIIFFSLSSCPHCPPRSFLVLLESQLLSQDLHTPPVAPQSHTDVLARATDEHMPQTDRKRSFYCEGAPSFVIPAYICSLMPWVIDLFLEQVKENWKPTLSPIALNAALLLAMSGMGVCTSTRRFPLFLYYMHSVCAVATSILKIRHETVALII